MFMYVFYVHDIDIESDRTSYPPHQPISAYLHANEDFSKAVVELTKKTNGVGYDAVVMGNYIKRRDRPSRFIGCLWNN